MQTRICPCITYANGKTYYFNNNQYEGNPELYEYTIHMYILFKGI